MTGFTPTARAIGSWRQLYWQLWTRYSSRHRPRRSADALAWTRAWLVARSTWSVVACGLSSQIDAELLEFLGIIAPMEQVPLFGALGNLAFLRPDLDPRGAVDLLLD